MKTIPTAHPGNANVVGLSFKQAGLLSKATLATLAKNYERIYTKSSRSAADEWLCDGLNNMAADTAMSPELEYALTVNFEVNPLLESPDKGEIELQNAMKTMAGAPSAYRKSLVESLEETIRESMYDIEEELSREEVDFQACLAAGLAVCDTVAGGLKAQEARGVPIAEIRQNAIASINAIYQAFNGGVDEILEYLELPEDSTMKAAHLPSYVNADELGRTLPEREVEDEGDIYAQGLDELLTALEEAMKEFKNS